MPENFWTFKVFQSPSILSLMSLLKSVEIVTQKNKEKKCVLASTLCFQGVFFIVFAKKMAFISILKEC